MLMIHELNKEYHVKLFYIIIRNKYEAVKDFFFFFFLVAHKAFLTAKLVIFK